MMRKVSPSHLGNTQAPCFKCEIRILGYWTGPTFGENNLAGIEPTVCLSNEFALFTPVSWVSLIYLYLLSVQEGSRTPPSGRGGLVYERPHVDVLHCPL